MAEFYGTVAGQRGPGASRLGSRASGLQVTAQSWNGSVNVELHADGVTIRVGEGSTAGGRQIYSGLLSHLVKAAKSPSFEGDLLLLIAKHCG